MQNNQPYLVLARKWRPKSFSEVVGQEHVLQTLSNALTQNRLHHAYLFTGTRGVGKTTIGRILAKCLNCETGITATPCCKCEACLSIDAGKFVDLIEIDAASRTKVEDMRDILQNVQYTPNSGRFKIYLIDEVHMLSGHSFNALLKTLEEPPEHVKFFLATTDKQRLPITILSRCLQFNLKNVPPDKIANHLKTILTKENISYEEKALDSIARAAEGSIRDALSLLDQAISYGAGVVKTSEVNTMLGTIETDKLLQLCEALVQQNPEAIFTIIAELADLAADFSYVLDELLVLLQRIAILQKITNVNTTVWDNLSTITALTGLINPEDLQLYYQIGLIGKRDLSLAPNPRIGFEMTMLRMLAFQPNTDATTPPKPNLVSNLKPCVTIPIANRITEQAKIIDDKLIPAIPKTEEPEPLNLQKILPTLQLSGTTCALIQHCIISSFNNGVLELLLDPPQAPLLSVKHEERLSQAFSNYFQQPVHVVIKLGKNTSPMETNARVTARRVEIAKTNAQNALSEDQNIKTLIGTFEAKVIPDTVKSET